MSLGKLCEHGSLKRQCAVCDLEYENARLAAELAEMAAIASEYKDSGKRDKMEAMRLRAALEKIVEQARKMNVELGGPVMFPLIEQALADAVNEAVRDATKVGVFSEFIRLEGTLAGLEIAEGIVEIHTEGGMGLEISRAEQMMGLFLIKKIRAKAKELEGEK